jgi:hypothetical protein
LHKGFKYRANLVEDCKSNDWKKGIKGSVFDFGRGWPEMDGMGGVFARYRPEGGIASGLWEGDFF